MPLSEVQKALIKTFGQWGKPGSMRVDNGEPLGSPNTDTTTPLALWLIAHDIDMIWNKPHCPQMNGKVEHMQDTSQRWAEIDKAQHTPHLQERLDQEADIQRRVFKVTRLKNQTRLEAFAELLTAQRPWLPQSDDHFSENRVYEFLARKIYTRKVSSVGQVNHFGHKINVGQTYKGLSVQIKLDKDAHVWLISHDYKNIKSYSAKHLDRERILNLSVFQRTEMT